MRVLLACRTARGHGWTKADGDAHLPASGLAPAALRSPRVASLARAHPRIGSPLESRSRGLCVPPLRGRWRKGGYLHGMGGGRLPGGLVATKLDVKVSGSVV